MGPQWTKKCEITVTRAATQQVIVFCKVFIELVQEGLCPTLQGFNICAINAQHLASHRCKALGSPDASEPMECRGPMRSAVLTKCLENVGQVMAFKIPAVMHCRKDQPIIAQEFK